MTSLEHNDGSGTGRPQSREEIVALLQSHRRELDEFDVRQLSLFGSAARGDLDPHSDVDMIVQFSHTTYRRFVGLKSFLESLLGRKVDLLTSPALRGRLKEEIEKDLVHVPR
jgi:predicted nucleotidyltransferase